MICSISHLLWYQLLADPGTLLGTVGTGRLEITTVQSTSSNWQLLPSDSVYYIRNEAFGPLFQLGLSCDSHEPSLVSINLLSTEQQWELRPDDGDGVQVRNVALGEVGILNISRNGPGCGPGGVWSIKPIKMIDDVSFLSSIQISLAISTRSVPNDTSSAYPSAPGSPYYIPVGPAAAGIAFAIAVIFGVALWRLSPQRRRKHSRQEPEVELAAVNCSPSDPPVDAQEPLPQYRARDEGDHLPGYNEEQPHAEVGALPPGYPRPVAI